MPVPTVAALIITVCVYDAEPATDQCEIAEHQIPAPVTMRECSLFGQMIVLEWWQQQDEAFEFTKLLRWRCENGEHA
jgi:hypothetical protein